MSRTKRVLTLCATAVLMIMPTAAQAHTTDAIAQTGGSVTTLPVLGAGIQVEVILDASGNLSQVNLDPAAGAVATETGPHEIEFVLTESGTEIEVEAEDDQLEVEVEAADLVDLLGPGSWTADLFGTGAVTVNYLIGESAGVPAITLGDVVVPAGVEFVVRDDEPEDGEEGEAELEIDFFFEGFRKTLKIEVEVEDGEAELEISLRGKDVQRLEATLDELVGQHTWNGALCDGTPVTVTYEVGVDGSLTLVGVSGTDQVEVESDDGSLQVSLGDSEKELEVKLEQEDDGLWELSARSEGDCDHDDELEEEASEIEDDSEGDDTEFDDELEEEGDESEDDDSESDDDSGEDD